MCVLFLLYVTSVPTYLPVLAVSERSKCFTICTLNIRTEEAEHIFRKGPVLPRQAMRRSRVGALQ